jgi:hypothetical protein
MDKIKAALALALVLGTASATLAATRHPIADRQAIVNAERSGASAFGGSGSAFASPFTRPQPSEPTYMAIQTRGLRETN